MWIKIETNIRFCWLYIIMSSNLTSRFSFQPPTGSDTMVKAGVTTSINTKHQCITAMKEYENKSLEVRLTSKYCNFVFNYWIYLHVLSKCWQWRFYYRSWDWKTTRQVGRAQPTPWRQGRAVCLARPQPPPVQAQACLAHLLPTPASRLGRTKAPLEHQVSIKFIVGAQLHWTLISFH